MTKDLWRERGIAFMSQNRLEAALDAFESALSIDSLDVMALRYKGKILMNLNRNKEAEEALKKALVATKYDDKEGELETLSNLIIALRREKKWDEALNYIQDAAEVSKEENRWFTVRLEVLMEAGRQTDALDLVRSLTTGSRAQNPTVQLFLIRARLAKTVSHDVEELEQSFKAAGNLAPNDPSIERVRIELTQDPLQSLWDLGFTKHPYKGGAYILPPLCMVPEGPFLMGSDTTDAEEYWEDESPQTLIHLKEFEIAKYPVTVAEYACAVEAKQVREPPEMDGITWQKQLVALNRPVICISWEDAVAYAAWLSKVTGKPWRLPTEAEWEKAARGTDGRSYPWGNDRGSMPAHLETEPYEANWVGYEDPSQAGPYGLLSTVGNLWQWCSTIYKEYPYQADDGREDMRVNDRRVLRGGIWDGWPWPVGRVTTRLSSLSGNLLRLRGMRLVCGGKTS